MKKIKRLLSLTLGFVGCLLAGVFALQTPTDKAEKVDAATTYTDITSMSFLQRATHATTSVYFYFGTATTAQATFSSTKGVCNLHGVEQWFAYSQAMYDFASQITVKRGDTAYSLNETCIFTIDKNVDEFYFGCWGNVNGFTLAVGDEIIIPQGTTYELDENGDGVAEYAYKFAKGFRIVCDTSACSATLGCNGATTATACESGYWHGYTINDATQLSITQMDIVDFAGGETNWYVRMNNLKLLTTASNADNESLADWARQMLFATPTGFDENGKPTGYTYENFHDYATENCVNGKGIVGQNSENICFYGFQNDWDMLIIPQGTTLKLDTNNDGALDYNWVMSQTYTFMRWVGESTDLKTFNCENFHTATGFTCATKAAGATAYNGKCNGFIHQSCSTKSTITATSVESTTATTETKAVLSINKTLMEIFPAKYADVSVAGWEFNDAPFSNSCWATIENGYLTVEKKSGEAFAENDVIEIPAGTVFTNEITGTTYTFASKVSSVYKGGVWYSVEYYSITGVTFNVGSNVLNDFYMHFTSPDGTVYNGYNMSNGWNSATNGANGYYTEHADTAAFRQSIYAEDASGNPVTIATCQVQNYRDGLYLSFDNLFADGVKIIIPAGTVYFGTVNRDGTIEHGASATAGEKDVFWKFPQTFTMEKGATSAQINLPEAPVTTGNNVFVGYKLTAIADGTVAQKLYQAGEAFDSTAYTFEAVTLEMYMEKGASLRLSEEADQSGIRWTVNVNKAQLQSIKDTFGATINLGVRVRVVNAESKVSTTESAKVCVTDILGTATTGNYYEENGYIVYNMAYVMNDSFINVEINNGYSWLGDGFIEVVNSDTTTVKAYAVQNDNARSYRGMIDYFLNHSCTTTATETNTFQITRTLKDGTTEIRYYSFWNRAYQVLVSEAERANVEIKATDDSTYQSGL